MSVVEELEQAALMAICRGIGHYRPERSRLTTWATHQGLGGCRHWCRDRMAMVKTPAWAQERGIEPVKCYSDEDCINDRDETASEAAEDVSIRDVVLGLIWDECLSHLPPRQQQVYALVCVGGYRQVEVAQVLGVCAGTIYQDVRHIRLALRECLRG